MRKSCLKKITIAFLFAGFLCFSNTNLKAQILQPDSVFHTLNKWGDYLLNRNQDTAYIKNYSNLFSLRLFTTQKYNYFRLSDNNEGSLLRYTPRAGTNLGIGMAYKWFSVDVAANLTGKNAWFDGQKFVDLEANIFTSGQYIQTIFQYYLGYDLHKIETPISIPTTSLSTRNDIRSARFGIQYLHAFNYDRFSMKAPFVNNEIQRKSAGSVIGGLGMNILVLDGDSSLVPPEAKPQFNEALYYKDLNTIGLSFSGGYMYSFVYKEHYFITLGIIPGVIVNMGDYQIEERELMKSHISWQLRTMNAIGYNGDKWYGGAQAKSDIYAIYLANKARTDVGIGRVKFYVGYRFKSKKGK